MGSQEGPLARARGLVARALRKRGRWRGQALRKSGRWRGQALRRRARWRGREGFAWGAVAASLALAAAPGAGAAQGNLVAPAAEIEARLDSAPFDIIRMEGSRRPGDRTYQATVAFADGQVMLLKWARAHRSGSDFNNEPRFELAAYAIQKLFLDPEDWVVPPTVLRPFPLDWYRAEVEAGADATLDSRSVLVLVQYWLLNVSQDDFWDPGRFEREPAYRRHFANFNIFTYLIRHNDANRGNYLVSRIPSEPRVFAVDNGLSFSSVVSDKGARWRNMRVDVLPAATVERLRGITREELTAALETVAEFAILDDGSLAPMEPTANIDPERGVRRDERVVQLGLTAREIDDVWDRLQALLRDVGLGRYQVQ